MPEAKHDHNTPTTTAPGATRRTLFGAAALLALTIPARAAEPNPDAQLIALCNQFMDLERGMQAAFNSVETTAEWDAADVNAAAVRDAQAPLVDRICAMRFTTMEGAAAVASCWALWSAPEMDVTAEDDEDDNVDDRLMALLLRSFASVGGAA